MKIFNKKHLYVMLALDLAYVIFLGPAMISARDWIAVLFGVVVAGVLGYLTYKVVADLFTKEEPTKGEAP